MNARSLAGESDVTPPLPKHFRGQKETPDWEDREMLICYSVCEPVNKKAAHRDARSLTFYMQTVSNQAVAVVAFFSQSSRLQNLSNLPQLDQDLATCQFFSTSHSYSNELSDNAKVQEISRHI